MATLPKTARFSKVVETCGKPEVYVTFLPMAKDRSLQQAIKGNRIMSVARFDTGTQKDFGTVGFDRAVAKQLMIFPKSLKVFTGRKIVGINYDLLDKPAEVTRKEKLPPSQTTKKRPRPKPSLPSPARSSFNAHKTAPRKSQPKAQPLKVVERSPKELSPPTLTTLKNRIQKVLNVWDEGHEVKANKMLREILSSF